MADPLRSVTLWSDFAAAGGVLLGAVPVAAQPGACVVTEALEGDLATGRLDLLIPASWAQAADLTGYRVLRLTYVDASIAAGAFAEYWIDAVEWRVGQQGAAIAVTARDPLSLFGRQRLQVSGHHAGSPAALAATIVAHGPALFGVGAVTPTRGVELDVQGDLPIAVMRTIAEQVNAVADPGAGEHYAWQARRNGVTGYLLDLIQVGGSATIPDIRPGKNLQWAERRELTTDRITRAYVTAQGQPVQDAWFEITAVAAGSIVIAGIGGDTAVNPIAADNALVTSCEGDPLTPHWIAEGGAAYAITGTTRATRTLTIADTTGLAVGQFGRLAEDASGTPLSRLDLPNTTPYVGTIDVPFTPGTNWLPNPDYRDWPGTDPVRWESVDNPFTRVTGSTTLLGTAARNPADLVGSLRPEGSGWVHGERASVWVPAGTTVSYYLWFTPEDWGTLSEGLWQIADPLTGGFMYVLLLPRQLLTLPPENLTPDFSIEFPWGAPAGRHYEISRAFVVPADGTIDLFWAYTRTQAQANGGGSSLIGGGRVTLTPPGLTPPRGFFSGSPGATALARAVNTLLARQRTPALYETTFLDLSRFDAATWPYDTVTLGGSLRLVSGLSADPDVLRVVQVQRNLQQPLDTRVVLVSRSQTLTSQLFGILFPPAAGPGTPLNLTPEDPPAPPPPAASADAPYVLAHGYAGLPNARTPRGEGIQITDEGPGGRLVFAVTGLITEWMAVTAPNQSYSSVLSVTEDPIPFDTVPRQVGAVLSLNGDGTIAVTATTRGIVTVTLFGEPHADATHFDLGAYSTGHLVNTTGSFLAHQHNYGAGVVRGHTLAGQITVEPTATIHLYFIIARAQSGTLTVTALEAWFEWRPLAPDAA